MTTLPPALIAAILPPELIAAVRKRPYGGAPDASPASVAQDVLDTIAAAWPAVEARLLGEAAAEAEANAVALTTAAKALADAETALTETSSALAAERARAAALLECGHPAACLVTDFEPQFCSWCSIDEALVSRAAAWEAVAGRLRAVLEEVEEVCADSFEDAFAHRGGHYTRPLCPLCGCTVCDEDCVRHLIRAALAALAAPPPEPGAVAAVGPGAVAELVEKWRAEAAGAVDGAPKAVKLIMIRELAAVLAREGR